MNWHGSRSALVVAALVVAPAAVSAQTQSSSPEAGRTKPTYQLSGYLQVDLTLSNQLSQNELSPSTGAPLNQERFLLRRGHLRVEAERGLLASAVELDANTVNGPQLRPVNAELSLRTPGKPDPAMPSAILSAGLIRIPFGFEVQEADSVRPFLERSTFARALFPGQYDLGAKLTAKYRFMELRLAVMNGSPVGDHSFPAMAPTHHKDLVGRLGTEAAVTSRIKLGVGVSANSGTGLHPGSPTTKDQLVWRDDNGDGIVQATEVQVVAGSSASPSQLFHRFAVGADARLTFRLAPNGDLALRGEWVRASNLDRAIEPADPIGTGYDLREQGWSLGATQELTRWALVGARCDHYSPDEDASVEQGARLVPRNRAYSTLALLMMIRYESARLSLEYDRNRNHLGRGVDGAPQNLKSDALVLRAQAVF